MATMDLNLIPKEGEQPNALVQSSNGPSSRDDFQLARLGKRPVLKRNFGFMAILGFSCTVLITWEGSLMCVFCFVMSI